ncbi:hypothetical protein, partial [Viscerimonas tarda]
LSNGGLQAGIQVGLNGIGNLADGHNFFDNWYWSAGMGFASGAISGYNLAQAGGRNYWWGNEVQYGRTQWSFFTSELPKTSVKFNINFITATANNTCVPQSLTELERSRGGSRTELDFRESTGWTEQGVAMRNGESGNSNFLRGQGFENEIMSGDDISNALKMQGASNVGNNVTITHNEGDIRHMTTVKQIDYYQSGKVNIYGRGRTYQLNELKGLNPYYFLIK